MTKCLYFITTKRNIFPTDMEKLYDELLVELECPICMTYMSPPIRQCSTGHSICEPCRKRLPKCPLCQGNFTDSKNITLEALARKMHYPCVNFKAGCVERLALNDRESHEKHCTFRVYKCPDPRCREICRYENIIEHWKQKKSQSRPYMDTNVCHTKIEKNEKTYVNIIQAFGEIFWYKFNLNAGKLCWVVQYVGAPEKAPKYYFEIEVFKLGQPLRKILMSEYVQSIDLDNRELFQAGNCVMTYLECVSPFFGEDQVLIYYMKVKEVDVSPFRPPREQIKSRDQSMSRDQSTSRDSTCSEPTSSCVHKVQYIPMANVSKPGRRGGNNYRGHQNKKRYNPNNP